jgi:hypothetical protein
LCICFAVCALAFAISKDGALAFSAFAGKWLGRAMEAVYGVLDRFLIAPTADFARRLGEWTQSGDGALGRFATASGQLALATARAPALPLLVLLAVAAALVLALVAPGVAR